METHNFTLEENPNPLAKIAFLAWTPFHYYVYKNIIKHIPEAEFVVCKNWYLEDPFQAISKINNTVSFLKEQDAHWRVLKDIDQQSTVETFFGRYEIIVSLWYVPPLESLSLDDWFLGKKSVLINYGAGKDLINFAPWIAYFDISLVDGPRMETYHKLLVETHIVGVPKYDDWFAETLDNEKVAEIKAALDPSKKTVLYLPTHSALSSLYYFADEIIALKEKYNVIVKFHNHNKLTEKSIVEKFEEDKNLFLFGEEDDILLLFRLADIVISDSSSALFETVLIDKPLVILDTTNDTSLLKKHVSGQEFNGFWYSGGLTYEKSIEEEIKKNEHAVGVVVKTGDNLAAAIEIALTEPQRFANPREILRKNIFSYSDGSAGRRAADIILAYVPRERPTHPLLGMAIRSYYTKKLKTYKLSFRKILERVDFLSKQQISYTMLKQEKNVFRKLLKIIQVFFRQEI